jgi:Holliday junction DNA helicase RuvA
MISQIKGTIIDKQPPTLVVDVHGVGYEILAPMNTFYQLPDVGQEVKLLTQLIVREDSQTLYGFVSSSERELFRSLIKVNGVGPKMAITILSAIEPDTFAQCIADQNVIALTKIPGVGKKTAERLIIEMRDRLAHWQNTKGSSTKNYLLSTADPKQDAISALIALGYKPQDAQKTVHKIASDGLSSEEMIRLALKNL